MNDELENGTIVQVTDKKHQWFQCLLVVDDILSRDRVMAYCTLPTNDNIPNAHAYLFLQKKQFVIVGHANIIVE